MPGFAEFGGAAVIASQPGALRFGEVGIITSVVAIVLGELGAAEVTAGTAGGEHVPDRSDDREFHGGDQSLQEAPIHRLQTFLAIRDMRMASNS